MTINFGPRATTVTQVITTDPASRRPGDATLELAKKKFLLRESIRTWGKHALLLVLCFVLLYPLIWMIVSSLRPSDEIFRQPGIILDSFELQNYADGWTALALPFWRYLLNSAIVTLGAILGTLISCSLAAYAFARLQFRGRNVFFALMLLTIMLPFHVVIVPQYIMFNQLGWVNTFLPLIVPKFLATDAFFVFLMVQFIRNIPKELDEAARIDGAGHGRIFFQIILPLMKPALATAAIFTFVWTFNDFFGALLYLNTPDTWTVPLALRNFLDAQGKSNFGPLFAMSIVSLVPVFIAFLVGQKFLIKGIATTGIK